MDKKIEVPIKDMVPYINSGKSYTDLVNKEVGFITRIVGGYYRQEEFRKKVENKELPEGSQGPFDIQKNLVSGTNLLLRKDTENKFDPNAVEVLTTDLQFLGYLKADIAREIKDVDNFKVKIYEQYTGDGPLKRNSYGASLTIVNLENLEKLKNGEKEEK